MTIELEQEFYKVFEIKYNEVNNENTSRMV